MTRRWLSLLLCTCVAGCSVYKKELLDAGGGGASGQGQAGGGAGDAGEMEACVPSQELCNDVDDDCNGSVDDGVSAHMDCSARYHATVECGRRGVCIFNPMTTVCDPGYYHCDGLPETGCESRMPCCPDCAIDGGNSGDDAGEDDAGS